MTVVHSPGGPPLPESRFEGRLAFRQLVRDALACAVREGWREIILSDADFEDWPLGERQVAQSLQEWSRRGRQITLLARRWEPAIRQHARFVHWRRTWSDIVVARVCRQADPLELPSAIWTPAWAMQRHDTARSIGVASHEVGRRRVLHEQLQEWLVRSSPGFPAFTLGL